jgi:hypothetical protein
MEPATKPPPKAKRPTVVELDLPFFKPEKP